jgi:cytoskeletal protein CcmA (bactofilin family)
VAGSIRIEGTVSGQVEASHTAHIAESAEVDATLRAAHVVIAGTVKGRVNGERVELLATAHAKANLTSNVFVVHEGAAANGRLRTTEAKTAARRRRS